jgi:hypothetical protein
MKPFLDRILSANVEPHSAALLEFEGSVQAGKREFWKKETTKAACAELSKFADLHLRK